MFTLYSSLELELPIVYVLHPLSKFFSDIILTSIGLLFCGCNQLFCLIPYSVIWIDKVVYIKCNLIFCYIFIDIILIYCNLHFGCSSVPICLKKLIFIMSWPIISVPFLECKSKSNRISNHQESSIYFCLNKIIN